MYTVVLMFVRKFIYSNILIEQSLKKIFIIPVHGNWPRNTIFGLPRKVMATVRRLFIPPLYVSTRWSATYRNWLWVCTITIGSPKAVTIQLTLSSCTLARSWLISFSWTDGGTPFSCENIFMCSRAVRSPHSISC